MSSIKAKFRILEQEPIKAVFKVNAVIPADEIKEDLQNEVSRAKQAENQLQGQINGITGDIDDISEELTTKADKSNTYTKAETNNLLDGKQPIGDYATNSALTQGLATKQPIGNYALKSEIPDVSNFATKQSLNQTNNNLDALTGEVENISGELDNKADKSEIPTKTSDLENDSNFTTESEVAQMIAQIPQFEVRVVQQLPQTGEAMVLYLVPKDGEAPDVYLEYIWLATTQSFELIGSTTVDLTDYVKNTDYASNQKGGTIRTSTDMGFSVSSVGYLRGVSKTLEQYNSLNENSVISKGTLENIKEDLVTSIGNTKYQPVGDYATNTALTNGLSTKQNTISDLSTIRSQASNSVQYDSVTKKGLYLTTHPELGNNSVKIPFIHNDIAYLLEKGGSCKYYVDGVLTSSTQLGTLFNGKPNYFTSNPQIYNEWAFEITLDTAYLYANVIYVDFGSLSWRCKYVKIERRLNNSDEWVLVSEYTNNASSAVSTVSNSDSIGIKALRFTFREPSTGTRYNTGFRIAQIGLLNYQSNGAQSTLLGLSGGTLYGNVNFASGELIGYQKAPTITKASNNQSGIIQHADGRMEQWGIATSSTTGETEFTMNNSFIDTNFQVFIEPRQSGDLVHYAIPSAKNKFKARIQNTSGAFMTCQFQWRAYGFWK